MKYYHGAGRRGPYFEGWYLKCQTRDGRALALIPAVHQDRTGRRSASLQVLAEDGAWWLEYPESALQASGELFQIWLDGSLFNRKGIWLNVEGRGLSLHGALQCGPFTPLKSDIMGPFRFLPGMECSHGVISMGHALEGTLTLNGAVLDFAGGTGYVETDRGRSFPSAYLWTQCAWREARCSSLMLSIADIPLAGVSFTGCICAVLYNGREYRLATYRGARVERWSADGAQIRQGIYRLEAERLEGEARLLRAPVEGGMGRTVGESLTACLRYRFWAGRTLLFEHTDRCASFEYAGEENAQTDGGRRLPEGFGAGRLGDLELADDAKPHIRAQIGSQPLQHQIIQPHLAVRPQDQHVDGAHQQGHHVPQHGAPHMRIPIGVLFADRLTGVVRSQEPRLFHFFRPAAPAGDHQVQIFDIETVNCLDACAYQRAHRRPVIRLEDRAVLLRYGAKLFLHAFGVVSVEHTTLHVQDAPEGAQTPGVDTDLNKIVLSFGEH